MVRNGHCIILVGQHIYLRNLVRFNSNRQRARHVMPRIDSVVDLAAKQYLSAIGNISNCWRRCHNNEFVNLDASDNFCDVPNRYVATSHI